MPGIRRLAGELRRALAAFEPGRYPAADCGVLAERLGRAAKACQAGAARVAARAAEGSGDGPGDGADRLAKATRTSRSRARSALDTSAKVEQLPETRDASPAGEVSADQAAEIVEVPGHEHELVDLAKRPGSPQAPSPASSTPTSP